VTDELRLDHVNLVVRDMAETVAFYRLLGLSIRDGGDDWDHHHRNSLVAEGTRIDFDSSAFAPMWDQSWVPGATGAVFNFRVTSRDRVDELFDRMTSAGYEARQTPVDAFWGARFAIVGDPDGNAVGIMSESDPNMRRPIDPPT
jgi:catechol 2,3-dioxygenase-like lactoylglutathione lyase family enzyme